MKINILTLFPEMFPGCLGCSLAGKALADGKFQLNVVNIRDFATDHYKTVDDTPFGGGAGMVMKAEVIDRALSSLSNPNPVFYLSARGKTFCQQMAHQWAESDEMTFLCGRFEGVDERVIEKWQMQEVSIGDIVLSGGEPALLTMLDATIRLIPGVMGNKDSQTEESFENGLLEYPQYTKPQVWQGREVPAVLLSGNHAQIKSWRQQLSENLTKTRRPDLWDMYLVNHKQGVKNDKLN